MNIFLSINCVAWNFQYPKEKKCEFCLNFYFNFLLQQFSLNLYRWHDFNADKLFGYSNSQHKCSDGFDD